LCWQWRLSSLANGPASAGMWRGCIGFQKNLGVWPRRLPLPIVRRIMQMQMHAQIPFGSHARHQRAPPAPAKAPYTSCLESFIINQKFGFSFQIPVSLHPPPPHSIYVCSPVKHQDNPTLLFSALTFYSILHAQVVRIHHLHGILLVVLATPLITSPLLAHHDAITTFNIVSSSIPFSRRKAPCG
jgi:hypothetical protein